MVPKFRQWFFVTLQAFTTAEGCHNFGRSDDGHSNEVRRPALGACDTAGLLLDPTVQELDSVIEQAVRAASESEDTLIIAVLGHGEYAGDDFYVMVRDSSPRPRPHRTRPR
ncbi:hypothetical protein [Amycolatopsis sp. NPDC051071]|uniref:hypothetical protein n=1 Tax=Amycolatopsis sp. NPDC051071 TaxID=3154637 RepID=UPI00343674BD